jgi:chemotaxis protein methyltransferase CheR
MTPEAEIRPGDVEHFLAAIHDRYGYDLRGYAPASMRRRVQAAVRRAGVPDVPDLERRSLAQADFFADVLENLTVQVSEMFRDPPFFHAFRRQVVPLLRTYPRLNIWNSGCAAGEEAYSLAILLQEEGLYDRAQIYATDLSPRAVERARQGVYAASSLEALTTNYLAAGGTQSLGDYFTVAYDRIAIAEPLRRNILFLHHDLVGDHVFAEMDAVFCRNVLIYFGRELQTRVLRKLADSLRPGGFLCLGPSERLNSRDKAEERLVDFIPEQRIYRQDRTT